MASISAACEGTSRRRHEPGSAAAEWPGAAGSSKCTGVDRKSEMAAAASAGWRNHAAKPGSKASAHDGAMHPIVVPAKAGTQGKRRAVALDSRFRGNDVEREWRCLISSSNS